MNLNNVSTYRGQKISTIPASMGIYAWYYRPKLSDPDYIKEQTEGLLTQSFKFKASIRMRYGWEISTDTTAHLTHRGESSNHLTGEVLEKAINSAPGFVSNFLRDDSFLVFGRPLYIGISKNLKDRVYNQHYLSLVDHWEDKSIVSQYLNTRSNRVPTAQICSDLNIKRTFALEARLRGLAPSDLLACVLPLENNGLIPDEFLEENGEPPRARSLERALHLLVDPIFGES